MTPFANSEYNEREMKGQDILVLLKLLSRRGEPWSYAQVATELDMSASEVHAAVKRCEEAGLYNPYTREPNHLALREFLLHGVRYAFPARPGPIVQGLPTSYAAPPLNKRLVFSEEKAPVMPYPSGPRKGAEIKPLYRSAPEAASRDAGLHELLALVDALRTGRTRERKLAEEALSGWLSA